MNFDVIEILTLKKSPPENLKGRISRISNYDVSPDQKF